ncbi:unnamed protein product [Hapterophycus canaliculatus]
MRPGESSISSGRSGSQLGGSTLQARSHARGRQERRSKWMIVSAEQVNGTAEKLRDQAEQNKLLESTIESHKRERVRIYDAAMKQASKREKKGIDDAKLVLEREQSKMRSEVDQELRKIGNLYQEHCRDYAQMVSDECEESISKAAAELRKDWARQKKNIDELVQCGGEEDRKVSVIARAVMEQLQEEKMDGIAALRADVYADVKMEFENREVAMRDALQSDYQADLDGQLLLAQIRHQKEIDRLRTELCGDRACVREEGAETVDTDDPHNHFDGGGETRSGDPSSTQTPSTSRRLMRKKMDVRTTSAVSDSGLAATPSAKQPGLGRKLPVFKTPVQRHSADIGSTKAARPASCSMSNSVQLSRTLSPGSRATKNTRRCTEEEDDKTTALTRKKEVELDGGVTGALVVSPTKAIPGVVTPLMQTGGRGLGEESSGSKKKTKRLF